MGSMANGTMVIADRISFGNRKLRIYNGTAVPGAATDFFPGCDVVEAVKAENVTDNADHFKEVAGAQTAASTKNKITLDPVSDGTDGVHAWIWMR